MEIQDKIRDYVDKNSAYYMKKYRAMKKTGKKVSWNWSAFFFMFYWFAYRRMYTEAVLSWFVREILTFIYDFSMESAKATGDFSVPLFFSALRVGMFVWIGRNANYYYLNKLERLAKEEENLTDGQIQLQREKNTGVSIWALVISVLLYGLRVLFFL